MSSRYWRCRAPLKGLPGKLQGDRGMHRGQTLNLNPKQWTLKPYYLGPWTLRVHLSSSCQSGHGTTHGSHGCGGAIQNALDGDPHDLGGLGLDVGFRLLGLGLESFKGLGFNNLGFRVLGFRI